MDQVTPNLAPPTAGRPTTFIGAARLRAVGWLLERRLSRKTRTDFAELLSKNLVIRTYSAAACFISMLLAAWVGAFLRSLSLPSWQTFRTLDASTLLMSAAYATRHDGYLLPVLVSWAVILLLTPTGYTFAFPAAAIAAGVLGYIGFTPPSFRVTAWVAPATHWLISFDNRWDQHAIVFFISSIFAIYVLQHSAIHRFSRGDELSSRRRRAPRAEPYVFWLARKLCATVLALLVLLLATWTASIIRLAVSHADVQVTGHSFSLQGGLYQGVYLLILAAAAVLIPQLYESQKWLAGAAVLAALYSIVPNGFRVHSVLVTSATKFEPAGIGAVWGGNSLWLALFIFIPLIVLGPYVIQKLLSSS